MMHHKITFATSISRKDKMRHHLDKLYAHIAFLAMPKAYAPIEDIRQIMTRAHSHSDVGLENRRFMLRSASGETP